MDRKKVTPKRQSPETKEKEVSASVDYQKLYEEEKAKNERLLRQMFFDYRTVMLMTDLQGKILQANRAAIAFYGYPKETLEGMYLQELDVFSEEKVEQALGDAVGGRKQHFVTRHRLFNGNIRDVELYSGVIDIAGEKRLFATIVDITKRVKARRKLKAHLERFRKVFEISPDMVTISSVSDGTYVEVNERFIKVSGYKREEVIGKSALALGLWANPDDRKKFIDKFLKDGFLLDYPVRFRKKNGEVIHTLLSAYLMKIKEEPYLFAFTKNVEEVTRTRDALEQSELKFRQSFAISPFAIAITRLKDGRYVEVNDAFLAETGFQYEEIIGKTAHELDIWVNPRQRELLLKKIVEQGYAKDFPVRLRMKNGKQLHALVSTNIIELEGEPHLISITRNIEEYRQALRALRKSELRYKALFELSPAGIVVLDDTGTILEANPSFCGLLSYRPDEIVGKKVWDALFPVAPLKKESVLRDIHEILNSREPIRKEVVNYDKNGRPVYLQLYETAIELEESRPAILSISMDISREKEFRNELARQAERLKEAQEIGRLGSWELIWKDRKLTWSAGLYHILELDPSQKPDYGVFQQRIFPDDLNEARRVLKDSIKRKKSFKYIHRLQLDNGKIKWVIERGKSFYDEKGNVIRTHGTVQDITRLKEAEDQLKELNEQLEEKVRDRTAKLKKKQQDLSRLVSDMQKVQEQLVETNTALQNLNRELEAFSFSVSHDLKAPVRAIRGFANILKEDYYRLLDEDGQVLVDDIVSETYRMAEIIEALLQLSRAGRKNLNYVEFDLLPLVRSVFSEQQKHYRLPRARLKIETLPAVFADYSLTKQLISNLLSNALKYSSKTAEPVVEFGWRKEGENDAVVFFVKDNGVGFDADASAKMFDPFSRLHSRKEFDGTGIGLAIAKRIVNRHGGHIWAHGEKGNGATFYFTLSEEMKPAKS